MVFAPLLPIRYRLPFMLPSSRQALINFGDTLVCTDTSFIAYQWYANTTLIPGATYPVLIVTQDGNYNIQVTDKNGCKSFAVGINVTLTGLLLPHFHQELMILLFPLIQIHAPAGLLFILRACRERRFPIINMLWAEVPLSPVLLLLKGDDTAIDISKLLIQVFILFR